MKISLTVFQDIAKSGVMRWTTIGLGRWTSELEGRRRRKLQDRLTTRLRAALKGVPPRELARFRPRPGRRLEVVHLELRLQGQGRRRKLSGEVPLVVETHFRSVGDRAERALVVYPPFFQDVWWVASEHRDLSESASRYLSTALAGRDDDELEKLFSRGKPSLQSVRFSAEVKSLIDQAKRREPGVWDDLEVKKKDAPDGRTLAELSVDETAAVIDDALRLGRPRSPHRERLRELGAREPFQSILVVGAPGVGKRTLVNRFISDLLEDDGYHAHFDTERVRRVRRLSGARIIAGMSYVGEWEERALTIIDEAREPRTVLHIEDLHAFGSLGRTVGSTRNLAELFRGPIARAEVRVVARCTEEQLARLEEDAPGLVEAFQIVRVHPATRDETLRLLLHEARDIEARAHNGQVDTHALRLVCDKSRALLPGAQPGAALELLKETARFSQTLGERAVRVHHLWKTLTQKTGYPEVLLREEKVLKRDDVVAALSGRVTGQAHAIDVSADVICAIKAGLTERKRPDGVLLFTGPTGTGKTELAKALAAYLYSDTERLIRFDMSELSGPDAAARLVGDHSAPEGELCKAIRRQPFGVVLLDEIEKAHPSVLSLLLQLFDEGRLTDALGNIADFSHAVIVMTSNLGVKRTARVGFGDSAQSHFDEAEVRRHFPPELFNRIDEVVPFNPIDEASAKVIARMQLDKLFRRRGLTERAIFVRSGDDVVERVAARGIDDKLGARSVRGYIERELGARLSAHLSARPAGTQIVTFRADREDGFELDVQVLEPCAHEGGRYTLAPVLSLPASGLRRHLDEASARLVALDESGTLRDLGARVRQALARDETWPEVVRLDNLRDRAAQMARRLEELGGDDDEEVLALEVFPFETRAGQTVRVFHPRAVQDHRAVRREEILELLAETAFFKTALARVERDGEHEVQIELARLADARSDGERAKGDFFEQLVRAYCALNIEVVESAVLSNGEVYPFPISQHSRCINFERVVLRVSGPSVRARLAGEEGVHFREGIGRLPQMVRVSVLDAVRAPRETLASRLHDERATPIVRTYTDVGHAQVVVQDHRVQVDLLATAKRLRAAIEPIIWTRMSREVRDG